MPKVKARRKAGSVAAQSAHTPRPSMIQRRPAASDAITTQSLAMTALVVLGCFGMAISFAFFTTDPNRYLFSGMAVIMALMWLSSFVLRLRKKLRQGQR